MLLIPYHDDNPTRRFPYVTITIIVVNVLAAIPFGFYSFQFAGESPSRAMRVVWTEFGFVPRQLTNLNNGQPVEIDLYREFGENPAPVNDRTLTIQPTLASVALTLVSCMFLHGGWWHLLGNMLFFWIYGNNVEDRLGHVVFTLFYIAGGIAATLCHWLMAQQPFDAVPMIGASGAVAAVMGAYIVTFPRAHIHVLFLLGCIPLFFKVPAMFLLAIWVGEQLLAAFWEQQGAVTDVALWAHIGGFAFGAIIMPFLALGAPEPSQDWGQEAKEQFDYQHVDPAARIPPNPEDRGIWWEESNREIAKQREQDASNPGIRWDEN
jgi:membrane associated rhomboid family serine protease